MSPVSEDQDWIAAIDTVHEINGSQHDAILLYAKAWADRVEVDYDEGPCAIGFVKGASTFWFLIDDAGCDWDTDRPHDEMILALLAERDRARELVREACDIAEAHVNSIPGPRHRMIEDSDDAARVRAIRTEVTK